VREEDREYYWTHKPSPLVEVEFADTRNPITSVLGSVDMEKSVMDKSSHGTPRPEGRHDHAASPASTSSFCSVSAARKRRGSWHRWR
jgi:hypothetical protein